MASTIELTASDGHRLAAYRATPSGQPRGAVVVIQEIFGVNAHIRSVADRYASDGYLVIAPAMYDRSQRDYETGYKPPEIEAGRAVMQKLDWKQTMLDVEAAVAHAREAGNVGIVGFCWGGTVSWVAAARVANLAAAVAYYPGGIANFADESPQCPMLCHFGERDTSPTPDAAKSVMAKHPAVTAYFYAAGHGFNCDQRASFDTEASKLARSRTLEFFRKHIG
ncbi:MAG TPA: dienelactone hydrolase family protein [Casimicrobiaceae bacterium]|nr:dienelactone hydrolase family protein [Casimicrobiaceae bacterium]